MSNEIKKHANYETVLKYQTILERKCKNDPMDLQIKKRRTICTACEITARVALVSFDALLLKLYVKPNPKIAMFLKEYEYQILGAKTEPDKFIRGLFKFYSKMKAKIKKENLSEDFLDFYNFWVLQIDEIADDESETGLIFNSYLCLLLQQFEFLSPNITSIVCGLNNDNTFMCVNDPYPLCDMPDYEIQQQLKQKPAENNIDLWNTIIKTFKKYNYDIKDFRDVEKLAGTANVVTNNLITMSPHIRENNKIILPENKFVFGEDFCIPDLNIDSQYFIDLLHKRKYTLPAKGVICDIDVNFCDSIIFQETFKDDSIVLLFRFVSKKYGDCMGFYNTKSNFFYSIYKNSTIAFNNTAAEKYILLLYSMLVCKSEDIKYNNINVKFYNASDESIYIFKNTNAADRIIKLKKYVYKQKHYTDTEISINGYIRKLPAGQVASVDAISYAVNLGYELEKNETFVRPFKKHINQIERNI